MKTIIRWFSPIWAFATHDKVKYFFPLLIIFTFWFVLFILEFCYVQFIVFWGLLLWLKEFEILLLHFNFCDSSPISHYHGSSPLDLPSWSKPWQAARWDRAPDQLTFWPKPRQVVFGPSPNDLVSGSEPRLDVFPVQSSTSCLLGPSAGDMDVPTIPSSRAPV